MIRRGRWRKCSSCWKRSRKGGTLSSPGRRWAGRAGRTLEGRVPSWPAGVVAGTLCRGGTRHSRGRVCWFFARFALSRWNSTFPGAGLLVLRAVCFVEVELDIPGGGFVGSSRGMLCRDGTRHSRRRVWSLFARHAFSCWYSTCPGAGLLFLRAVCVVEMELDTPGVGFGGSSRGLLCRDGTRHSQGGLGILSGVHCLPSLS